MIFRKRGKPIKKEDLQISAVEASSGELLRANYMNYWLERISGEDIAKFWNALRDSAKVVKPRISLEQWASGTISNQDFRVAVTAPITGDGFVLTFTVKDTSESNGAHER